MATSLKLDDAMKSRIRDLAVRRDRSSHWLMREAIREYVEREEAREKPPPDESSLPAALRSKKPASISPSEKATDNLRCGWTLRQQAAPNAHRPIRYAGAVAGRTGCR